ncbi:MAG: type II toxin-antitoxin system VapC family toxin [Bradymonadales bacterium]|nr:type II toxin-antitoxin system VapC family toxin [Bradymonadales bacterium]
MRLLLDTHVWLWAILSPARLNKQARSAIEERRNEVFLSAASVWEIAIKYHLGKLPLPCPPAEFVLPRLVRDGIFDLPVDARHAAHVATLPRHHDDPFDRLLIAQTQIEGLLLVTADERMSAYQIDRLEAG